MTGILHRFLFALFVSLASASAVSADEANDGLLDDLDVSPSCGIHCVDPPARSLFESEPPVVIVPRDTTPLELEPGVTRKQFDCGYIMELDMDNITTYRMYGATPSETVSKTLATAPDAPAWYREILTELAAAYVPYKTPGTIADWVDAACTRAGR